MTTDSATSVDSCDFAQIGIWSFIQFRDHDGFVIGDVQMARGLVSLHIMKPL
jgi:hypothetical protein